MNVSATAGGRAQCLAFFFIGACSLEAAMMHICLSHVFTTCVYHMCLPHVLDTYIRYIYHIHISHTCIEYMYKILPTSHKP